MNKLSLVLAPFIAVQLAACAASTASDAPTTANASLAENRRVQDRFAALETELDDFTHLSLSVESAATPHDFVDAFVAKMREALERATSLSERYESLAQDGSPELRVAVLVRQARIYDAIAHATLSAPFTVPQDLDAQLANVGASTREQALERIRERVRSTLAEKARAIECIALRKYATALLNARTIGINDASTTLAAERIEALGGHERVHQCAAAGQAEHAAR